MYKSDEKQILIADDFFLPFGGKLDKKNRLTIKIELTQKLYKQDISAH